MRSSSMLHASAHELMLWWLLFDSFAALDSFLVRCAYAWIVA